MKSFALSLQNLYLWICLLSIAMCRGLFSFENQLKIALETKYRSHAHLLLRA